MAKFTKKDAPPSDKEKAGNTTPAKAADARHKSEAVLGECDSTYHNK